MQILSINGCSLLLFRLNEERRTIMKRVYRIISTIVVMMLNNPAEMTPSFQRLETAVPV